MCEYLIRLFLESGETSRVPCLGLTQTRPFMTRRYINERVRHQLDIVYHQSSSLNKKKDASLFTSSLYIPQTRL